MKNFRSILPVAALLLGTAGAFGSNVLLTSITQGSPKNTGADCASPTALAESTCDTDATSIQCTLQSNGAAAYRTNGSVCTVGIFRNN